MDKVVDLAEYKENNAPHFYIKALDGNAHVIPVSVVEGIIEGRMKISELDDYEIIVRSILKEWLEGYNLC